MESTKAISSRFTELFNTDDREAAANLLAPQVTFHGGSAGEFTTRDALLDMISNYRATFPDAHSTVDDQIASSRAGRQPEPVPTASAMNSTASRSSASRTARSPRSG